MGGRATNPIPRNPSGVRHSGWHSGVWRSGGHTGWERLRRGGARNAPVHQAVGCGFQVTRPPPHPPPPKSGARRSRASNRGGTGEVWWRGEPEAMQRVTFSLAHRPRRWKRWGARMVTVRGRGEGCGIPWINPLHATTQLTDGFLRKSKPLSFNGFAC